MLLLHNTLYLKLQVICQLISLSSTGSLAFTSVLNDKNCLGSQRFPNEIPFIISGDLVGLKYVTEL